MQFSNILILAFAAASVEGKCWKSGPQTTMGNVSPYVKTVCDYLAGSYLHNEERYLCIVDDIGVKWNFSLQVSIRSTATSQDDLIANNLKACQRGRLQRDRFCRMPKWHEQRGQMQVWREY